MASHWSVYLAPIPYFRVSESRRNFASYTMPGVSGLLVKQMIVLVELGLEMLYVLPPYVVPGGHPNSSTRGHPNFPHLIEHSGA